MSAKRRKHLKGESGQTIDFAEPYPVKMKTKTVYEIWFREMLETLNFKYGRFC